MANIIAIIRSGAVGFIDWLDEHWPNLLWRIRAVVAEWVAAVE